MKRTMTHSLVLAGGLALWASTLQAADPAVTGTFRSNGKDAKIAFVMAKKGEPLSGKQTIVVVLTEKDTAGDPKPDFSADFGKFGSSLTITLTTPDGQIVGCQVNHDGNTRGTFSSIGKLKAENFKIEGPLVSAHLTTNGPVKTFGDTWDVDLTFHAKTR
jgi:hypothetical protein